MADRFISVDKFNAYLKKHIDAHNNCLNQTYKELTDGYYDGICACRAALLEFEFADVRPVIYCKNCIYAQNPSDTMIYCTYFECGTMSQNDFCSNAAQRYRSCETCNHYNVNTCWCSRYNDTTYSSNCSSYQAKE